MKHILFLYLMLPVVVMCQENATTVRVINDALTEAARATVSQIQQNSSIRIEVAQHPDDRWIETIFLEASRDKGLKPVTKEADVVLTVQVADVSTRYANVEGVDSVQRIINVDVSATAMFTTDNSVRVLSPTSFSDTTLLSRHEAVLLESKQHASTHAELPITESSLFDDVLEPVIFIGAAVATVVLLFTVRSK